MAKSIAEKGPVAINTLKKSLNYGRDHTVDASLFHIGIMNTAMIQTDDVPAAVMANMTKSVPKFAKL